ncbi:hypothetical protein E2C01_059685 [Portunus trituberculatus]|uniref:Uncharacterized protein n=1 Tax=Portunus trituberculatus TaxID=210409 RepID=A0A5B7H6W3_PORTR|nr:hypothetical protein [Portunus trituberculatus]
MVVPEGVETIIHKKEVDVEDVVEETTEEVGGVIIIQVVQAMELERVDLVAITVKTVEVDEGTILITPEVIV